MVELIKPEYLKTFEYDEVQCDRIKKLRERDSLEESAYAFLGLMGKLKRPYLTGLEEKLLSVLEAEYGIKN